jgi:hypothetical protein
MLLEKCLLIERGYFLNFDIREMERTSIIVGSINQITMYAEHKRLLSLVFHLEALL